MRILQLGILALVTLIAAASGANAAYPDKPIQLVINYPPGGMSDVIGRHITPRLSERLGQPVVIVNKAGAGGIVGAAAVAKASPDGYTLLLGTFGSNAVNDALIKQLPYHSLNDFTSVIPLASVPSVLSVLGTSPITSVQDLVARARAKPGELTHGSTGVGASPQLCLELLKQLANVDITEVMYKGGGPALLALLSGEVTMIFDTIGTSIPHIKGGKIRPLGISSDHRSPLLPEVPTIAESGYPGFNVVPWWAIWAPAGTPPEVVQRLNREFDAVLKSPEIRDRFAGMGVETMGGTVEAFAAFHRTEFARWAKFIKDRGIKAQ